MNSKNVLWLGLLFVLLLTAFCVTKYLNNYYPNITKVPTPSQEILETESIQSSITSTLEKEENSYAQIIELVEAEEKNLTSSYKQALLRANNESNLTTIHDNNSDEPVAATDLPQQQSFEDQNRTKHPSNHITETTLDDNLKSSESKSKSVPSIQKKSSTKKIIMSSQQPKILAKQHFKGHNNTTLSTRDYFALDRLIALYHQNRVAYFNLATASSSPKGKHIAAYLRQSGVKERDLRIDHKDTTNVTLTAIKKDYTP